MNPKTLCWRGTFCQENGWRVAKHLSNNFIYNNQKYLFNTSRVPIYMAGSNRVFQNSHGQYGEYFLFLKMITPSKAWISYVISKTTNFNRHW